MSKLVPIALVVAFAPTASTNSAGVQVSNYTGNAQLVLNAAQPAAGQTLDVRVQYSGDNGASDPWMDAGIAFAQVTNTSGNGHQVLSISADGLKAYVRVVSNISGGATALPHAVELIGNLAR